MLVKYDVLPFWPGNIKANHRQYSNANKHKHKNMPTRTFTNKANKNNVY